MQEQCHAIGETAGKIFKTLEKNNEERTASALQQEAEVQDSALFNQALGWLAREGKVHFSKAGKNLKVSLANANAGEKA